MEEFFKELMSTANPKYLERSMEHKSPKDLEDVCIYTTEEIPEKYSKTCLKWPFKTKPQNWFRIPIIAECRSNVVQGGAFSNTFDLH